MILDLQVRFRKHWHVDQAGVNRGGLGRKEKIWGEGVHLFTFCGSLASRCTCTHELNCPVLVQQKMPEMQTNRLATVRACLHGGRVPWLTWLTELLWEG